jgi:hypothetical protein
MPKGKKGTRIVTSAKQTQEATRKGEPIDLLTWLDETETRKDKDGNETTVRKNGVPDNAAEELKAVADKTLEVTEDAEKSVGVVKDDKGRIVKIRSKNWTLTIELAKRRVPATKDGKPYDMEYGNLAANTSDAMLQLMGGNFDETFEVNPKTKKIEEADSVAKYFRQGYGMLARNAASSRIATLVEGPEKGLEQAIKALMKMRPDWSIEKATAKAKEAMSED